MSVPAKRRLPAWHLLTDKRGGSVNSRFLSAYLLRPHRRMRRQRRSNGTELSCWRWRLSGDQKGNDPPSVPAAAAH
jgi:hypothetical protein